MKLFSILKKKKNDTQNLLSIEEQLKKAEDALLLADKQSQINREYVKQLKRLREYNFQNGDEYFFITDDGEICKDTWCDNAQKRLEIGNAYPNKHAAIKSLENKKTRFEIQKHSNLSCLKYENRFNKTFSDFYHIGIYCGGARVCHGTPLFVDAGSSFVFFSEEDAKYCIECVGNERIVQLLEGV